MKCPEARQRTSVTLRKAETPGPHTKNAIEQKT